LVAYLKNGESQRNPSCRPIAEGVLYIKVVYFQTPLGLLNLIGVQNIPEQMENPLESVSGLTMIPSLVMALLSSRVVVFWLLNVLLVICVTVATRRLYKDRGKIRVKTSVIMFICLLQEWGRARYLPFGI
jgi:hypothetical protein